MPLPWIASASDVQEGADTAYGQYLLGTEVVVFCLHFNSVITQLKVSLSHAIWKTKTKLNSFLI